MSRVAVRAARSFKRQLSADGFRRSAGCDGMEKSQSIEVDSRLVLELRGMGGFACVGEFVVGSQLKRAGRMFRSGKRFLGGEGNEWQSHL